MDASNTEIVRSETAEAEGRPLETVAGERIDQQTEVILQSLRLIRKGNPKAAEPVPERRVRRLQIRNDMSRRAAERLSDAIERDAEDGGLRRGRESRDAFDDFLPVSTFAAGAALSRCVACLSSLAAGRGLGTGFLVSDRLLITNNHVLPTAAAARNHLAMFDYEADAAGQPLPVTRYRLDPDALFLTSPEYALDYTLVAIGPHHSGPGAIGGRGFIPITATDFRHAIGERAIIIQHPNGGLKQVVTGENRIVSRLDEVIHYTTDTDSGSSGAPVFNEGLALIAVHHYGRPFLALRDETGTQIPLEMNEGVRISAIVADLESRLSSLSAERQAVLRPALLPTGPESMLNGGARQSAQAREEPPPQDREMAGFFEISGFAGLWGLRGGFRAGYGRKVPSGGGP